MSINEDYEEMKRKQQREIYESQQRFMEHLRQHKMGARDRKSLQKFVGHIQKTHRLHMKITNRELVEFEPYEYPKFMLRDPISAADIKAVNMDDLIEELQTR